MAYLDGCKHLKAYTHRFEKRIYTDGYEGEAVMGMKVSAMIYFRACPRCLGDMILGEDLYGRYLECLQCGYETDVHEGTERAKTLLDAKARVGAGTA